MKKVILIGTALVAVHMILRGRREGEPDIFYVDHVPGNFNGICLPPLGIFIDQRNQANTELLKHEMVHWRQYQRMGLGPYYYNYLRDFIKVGYDAHPMEREARANESAYCRDNYTECVRNGKAKTAFNPNFRLKA
jgi:hypothetical protein